MIKVHFLEVGLGDSLIIETEFRSKALFSIVDCHKLGGKVPTIEFLIQRDIKEIQAVFISHMHNDHLSGLPDLAKWVTENKIRVNFVALPILKSSSRALAGLNSNILDAFEEIKNAPRREEAFSGQSQILFIFDNNYSINSWRDDLHPGLGMVPISPHPNHIDALIEKIIAGKTLSNSEINSLSSTFLVKHIENEVPIFSLFCGDLEGVSWGAIKNIIEKISDNEFRKKLRFFKVPHHGGKNPQMISFFSKAIESDVKFVAGVTAPGNYNHPSRAILSFLKKFFPNAKLACTKKSVFCEYPTSIIHGNWASLPTSPDVETFLEVWEKEQPMERPPFQATECLGNFTVWVQDHPQIEKGGKFISCPCPN